MFKYDIVNGLAPAGSGGRYLEICTPSTGVRFGHVDPARFAVRHRLMYRCPETFDDGLPITLRTAAASSHEMVRALLALQDANPSYDVVFVDPWHGYEAGLADMHGALCLLAPGGAIVVHDTNPTDPDTVGAEYRDGAWCGLTYKAFVDFAVSATHGGHCVVDCDYGCGVVFGPERAVPAGLPLGRPDPRTLFEWNAVRGNDAALYAYFDRTRTALLNLVSPYDFADACGLPQPRPAPATDVPDLSAPAADADPALTVEVDGTPLPLQAYAAGWHAFAVPEGATAVRVRSPFFVPNARNPDVPDLRPLGAAVAGIRLDDYAIDLADALLCDGWHAEEASAGFPWRWTNGNARLRLPHGTRIVELFTTARAG